MRSLFVKISLTMVVLLLLEGCLKEASYNGDYRQRLVVDGRIDEGDGSIVALSLNIDYRDEYDREDVEDMVVRWAKVSVTDFRDTVVLTGRMNRDYPTQFIYTDSELIGRAGEKYGLIVEYSGRVWRSECYIPHKAELTDIRVERVQDTLYSISATLPPIDTPCSIECSLNGSSYYAPTILGIHEASEYSRQITINRPLENLDRKEYTTLFNEHDIVSLRLNTMDTYSFNYWNLWENNLINAVNPLFPAVDNLPTNISNNGLGLWAGYGVSYYYIGTVSEYDTME